MNERKRHNFISIGSCARTREKAGLVRRGIVSEKRKNGHIEWRLADTDERERERGIVENDFQSGYAGSSPNIDNYYEPNKRFFRIYEPNVNMFVEWDEKEVQETHGLGIVVGENENTNTQFIVREEHMDEFKKRPFSSRNSTFMLREPISKETVPVQA